MPGRRPLLFAVATGASVALLGCALTASSRPRGKRGKEDEVAPGEDLMQEHGVLERVLLVYEESAARLEHGSPLDLAVVGEAAGVMRRFVESYHERLEEDFLFPRLETAGVEVDLVHVLRHQHERGRAATDEVLALTTTGRDAPSTRTRLARLLRGFTRMYRPHAAREDTVLFPAFRDLLAREAYEELGEQFEEREHALFGEDGFRGVVRTVASLEQRLGIHDLTRFTIEPVTPG
jgi:hemerythrin-like domain-containing protein